MGSNQKQFQTSKHRRKTLDKWNSLYPNEMLLSKSRTTSYKANMSSNITSSLELYINEPYYFIEPRPIETEHSHHKYFSESRSVVLLGLTTILWFIMN